MAEHPSDPLTQEQLAEILGDPLTQEQLAELLADPDMPEHAKPGIACSTLEALEHIAAEGLDAIAHMHAAAPSNPAKDPR